MNSIIETECWWPKKFGGGSAGKKGIKKPPIGKGNTMKRPTGGTLDEAGEITGNIADND